MHTNLINRQGSSPSGFISEHSCQVDTADADYHRCRIYHPEFASEAACQWIRDITNPTLLR